MSEAKHDRSFADILREATEKPGIIAESYKAFHGYSIGNQLLAMMQCAERGIKPGPIATFVSWKNRGRFVRKGERAIVLCMPITCKRRQDDAGAANTDGAATTDGAKPGTFTRFVFRPNWFVMSQTDGADYEPQTIGDWNEDRALAALEITRIPFDMTDGNCHGYAVDRSVAVSPLGGHPARTLFHEIAHVLLGHTAENGRQSDSDSTPRSLREVEAESVAMICAEVLGLPGADEARGYVQHWNRARGSEPIPEKSAQKIFKVADQILKAGRPAESVESEAA